MRPLVTIFASVVSIACATSSPMDPIDNAEDEGTVGEGDDVADPAPPDPVTLLAYRIRELSLRDPHLFAEGPAGCSDVTALAVGAGRPEQSTLLILAPPSPAAPATHLKIERGACEDTASDARCRRAAEGPEAEAAAINLTSGLCAREIPGSTSGYSPAITFPGGPCFQAEPVPLQIGGSWLSLDLEDAVSAARYQGDPATGLVDGVVRGFIREADAEGTLIETPLGAYSLSELLAGGRHNCAHRRDDRDRSPDGSRGWYIYLNFTAEAVALLIAG